MPPSGYNAKQSESLKEFLRSCAESLAREAREQGRESIAALNREVESIDSYLCAANPTQVQIAVLQLTGAFYRDVRSLIQSGQTYGAAVRGALESVSSDVSAIMIPAAVA